MYALKYYVIKYKKTLSIHTKQTLLHVTDADRKARFDTEKKKVRVYQQLDVYKASRDAYSMEEGLSSGRTMYNNKSTAIVCAPNKDR